jgi:hypothetical protein
MRGNGGPATLRSEVVMTRHSLIPPLALVWLATCRAPTPLVPVVGPALETAALAGHWSGEHASRLRGRSGTIDLTVTAEGDSASGVVVMIPAGFANPLRPWRDPALDNPPSTTTPSVLTSRLFTIFDGRLVGDTIGGTFVTRPGPALDGETGRWVITREWR